MPSNDWDQYAQKPSGGSQWDQYASPSQPPAPLSGSLGGNVPSDAVPSGLRGNPTPAENNHVALMKGLGGMGKSLADTAQSIHNFNTPKDPSLAPTLPAVPAMQNVLKMDTSSHGDPNDMAGQVAGGLLQAAAPMDGLANMLPSAERAGAKLGEMSTRLKGVPVRLTHAAPELERAAQITDAGGGPMGAAQKLMYRSHDMVPMDFPEGRDFYSNMSRQSALDSMGQSPTLKGQLGKATGAFHKDLAQTANEALPATEIGYRGQPMNGGKLDYENAMGEYRNAKNIQGAGKFLLKKAAPAIVGTGLAAEGVRKLVGK